VVAVTVVVVETVLVTVSFCGPEATITATTTPNPSANPDAMIRAILVARPGEELGCSSTPARGSSDIAYSERPAASRASAGDEYSWARTIFPSRIVNTIAET
jgi:hypothetical protein